jgi:hypothetical protein
VVGPPDRLERAVRRKARTVLKETLGVSAMLTAATSPPFLPAAPFGGAGNGHADEVGRHSR